MPIIKRPQERTVPVGGQISPTSGARAAAAGAGIGQVLSQAGSQLVSRGVGIKQAAEQTIGAALGALNSSVENAMFTEKLNQANLTFAQQAQGRLTQIKDSDGNPTFNTLPKDIGNIGKAIRDDIGKTIPNPNVRQRFNHSFDRHVGNQQIRSLSEQRRQQLQYIQSNLSTGVQSLVTQAGADDPANRNYYMNQIDNIVQQAQNNGAITPNQAAGLTNGARRQILFNMYNNIIDQNPADGASILSQNSAADLGMDDQQHQNLQDIARAALRDVDTDAQQKQTSDANVNDEIKNLTASQMQIGIDGNTIGEKDIVIAKSNGHITDTQFESLLRSHKKVSNARLREAKRLADISTSIKNNEPLTQYKPSDVSKHFKRRIDLQTQNGQPPNLLQKAGIAAQYNGPVKPMVTEIQFGLKNGNTQQGIEALRAYEFLKEKRPVTISGLDRDSQAIAASAAELLQHTNLSEADAFNQAKSDVLNRDDEVVKLRRTKFRKEPAYKPENLNETINELLGRDNLIGGTFVSDQDALTIKGLLEDAYTRTGDMDKANRMVQAQLQNTFGESGVNKKSSFLVDKNQIMFAPPELATGIPSDKLRTQLENDVASVLPEGVTSDDVVIKSDSLTRQPNAPLSYTVMYRDRFGVERFLTDDQGNNFRWSPDPKAIMEKDRQARIDEAVFEQGVTKEVRSRVEALGDEATHPFKGGVRRQDVEAEVTGRQALDKTAPAVGPTDESNPADVARDATAGTQALEDANAPAVVNPEKVIARDPVTKQNVKGSPGLARAIENKGAKTHTEIAKSFLGKNEQQNADTLAQFFKSSMGRTVNPQKTPWCAAFANSVLQAGGTEGTGSLMAKSFLKWGTPTDTPKEGDIVVIHRTNDPALGHVGFFAGFDSKGDIRILGGNQKDQVSVQSYPKERLAGYRTPPKAAQIQKVYKERLPEASQGPSELNTGPQGAEQAPATPEGAPTANSPESSLGSVSAQFESGGKGPGTISSGRGDPGGKSYGTHQLASKTGTLQAYIKQSKFKDEFKGLVPGSTKFDAKWKELANNPEFGQDQFKFIKEKHFDPVRKKATDSGIIQSRAVDEALFSIGVQHGRAKSIVARAARRLGPNASEQETVKVLFDERRQYVKRIKLPAATRKSLLNRYDREEKQILGLI